MKSTGDDAMSEVKWIKIYTSMINNTKIKKIRRMPEGNNIILIWVFILVQAGECNKEGGLYITDTIPFTVEDLAEEFDYSIDVIRLALITLEKFQMIEVFEEIIFIKNWERYQNIEGLEKIREQTRLRVQRHRDKQKLLPSERNVTDRYNVTHGNATEEDKEKELEREEDIEIKEIDIQEQERILDEAMIKEKNKITKSEWDKLLITYNDLSLKDIRSITDKRKSKVKARMNSMNITFDDVIQAVKNISYSSFLNGENSRKWKADFDWLFDNDNNLTKVLEGKYTDKEDSSGQSKQNNRSEDREGIGFKI
jgi:predicted phage replisome organizer